MKKFVINQKKYLWLKYFKEKQEPITTNDMVQYDEEKFNNCITNLKSMNMTPTVVSQDAKLVFQEIITRLYLKYMVMRLIKMF